VPAPADFVVEAISHPFTRLPDPVLLPWLPTLITSLRSRGADLAPLLIREAGRIFPGRLADLDTWLPPWQTDPATATARPSRGRCPLRRLRVGQGRRARAAAPRHGVCSTAGWGPAG
jgi:hypothetical protein